MIKIFWAALWIFTASVYGDVNRFEAFMAEQVNDTAPPSAAFAVLRGNEIIYENSSGYNDSQRRELTSTESIYHIFSLTKIMTATVMMQLVQEGRITLNADIETFFPRLKAKYDDQNATITVLNLLNHSSGISDRSGDYRYMFDDNYYAYMLEQEEELEAYIDLPYLPGSEAKYSSAEYVLLGKIMEKVTGEPFADLIRKRVLEPAKMERSGFTYTDKMAEDQVYGTVKFFSIVGFAMRMFMEDDWRDHYEGTTLWLKQFDVRWQPAGGLVSSIHDMALFLKSYQAGSFLDAATQKTFLHAPNVKVNQTFSNYDDVRFGIGWYHLKNNNEFFLQHQGLGPGYRTIMRIYPEYDLSFVILTSQTETDIDLWADKLFESLKARPL